VRCSCLSQISATISEYVLKTLPRTVTYTVRSELMEGKLMEEKLMEEKSVEVK
jgi:hypothetical protein